MQTLQSDGEARDGMQTAADNSKFVLEASACRE